MDIIDPHTGQPVQWLPVSNWRDPYSNETLLRQAGLWDGFTDYARPDMVGQHGGREGAMRRQEAEAANTDWSRLDGYTRGTSRKDYYETDYLRDPSGKIVAQNTRLDMGPSMRTQDYVNMASVLASAYGVNNLFNNLGIGAANTAGTTSAGAGIGATSSNQLTPALIESAVGTPGYGVSSASGLMQSGIGSVGAQQAFDAPTQGYFTSGGADGSVVSGMGGYEGAITGAPEISGLYSAPTTGVAPAGTQSIEVVGPRLPNTLPSTLPSVPAAMAPIAATALPDATAPDMSSTPETAQRPTQTVPSSNSFADFVKKNPGLAMRVIGALGGIGAAAGAVGNQQNSGGIGSGQAGMTAVAPEAFRRQYVAPPAGYRPGFDPEHKFFTGIGAAGMGG